MFAISRQTIGVNEAETLSKKRSYKVRFTVPSSNLEARIEYKNAHSTTNDITKSQIT